TVIDSGYTPEATCTVCPGPTREAAAPIVQNGSSAVPWPMSVQRTLWLSTYRIGALDGGGGGVPIVVESSTAPRVHVTSSLEEDGPQTASTRRPSLLTSMRRCSVWKARNAVREFVVV